MRGKKHEQQLNHKQRRALNRQALQSPVTQLPYAFMHSLHVCEYVEKLITIFGPDYAYQTESEFCKSSGCPPEKLEWWLKEEWIQHNISKVELLQEKPGPFPLILISADPDARPCFCTIRLFSVQPGIGTPPMPTKQWRN